MTADRATSPIIGRIRTAVVALLALTGLAVVVAVRGLGGEQEAAAPSGPRDGSACRAAEVAAVAEDRGSLMSNTKTQVVLTNVGTRRCGLTGVLGVSGIRADGSVAALETSTGSYFGEPAPPTGLLEPGAAAAFYLVGGRGCQAAIDDRRQTWAGLRLQLPADGGTVDVRTGFDTACGIAVSGIGRPDPGTDLG